MTSPAHGQQKDSYTLSWNVQSYYPIKEYKVVYKIAQVRLAWRAQPQGRIARAVR